MKKIQKRTADEMGGWYQLNEHEFEQTSGNSERQGSLVCCSPRGCRESDMTERLNSSDNKNAQCMQTSLMAQQVKNLPALQETQEVWVQSLGQDNPLQEENGNPLQYSRLKNPVDRGAWQATVHRVAKSRA